MRSINRVRHNVSFSHKIPVDLSVEPKKFSRNKGEDSARTVRLGRLKDIDMNVRVLALYKNYPHLDMKDAHRGLLLSSSSCEVGCRNYRNIELAQINLHEQSTVLSHSWTSHIAIKHRALLSALFQKLSCLSLLSILLHIV